MTGKAGWWHAPAALAAGALLATVVVPLYLIAQSPQDFTQLDPTWLRHTALALALMVFLGAVAVWLLLRRFVPGRVADGFVWAVPAWAATAGLAIPISRSVEMVDPGQTPVAWLGLALAAVLTALLVWAATGSWRQYVAIYLLVQSGMAVLPHGATMARAWTGGGRGDPAKFLSLSPRANTLVISMDDLSGRLMREELAADAGLRAAFAGFTLFEDVTGNAPGTVMSIATELYGARNFKTIAADEQTLLGKLDRSALALNDSALDAAAYGSYTIFASDPSRRLEVQQLAASADPRDQMDQVKQLYRYVSARLGTRYLVRIWDRMGVRGADLSTLMLAVSPRDSSSADPLFDKLERHKGASWDRAALNSLRDYDALVRGVRVGQSPYTVRYMHFLFTHFPVDLDATCQYRSDDAAWFAAHQNSAGARAEARCALRQMVRLLDSLKRIGAFDRSTIVFKSDHGKKTEYSDPPDNAGFGGTKEWGYDRYRPFLMIKGAKAPAAALRVDRHPAAISDLAATVCEILPKPRRCEGLAGANLLDPAGTGPGWWVYLPAGPNSTHQYNTLRAVAMRRGEDLRLVAARR